MLSNSTFVFIGKLSYSIYLWHWPVIVLFKNLKYQLSGFNNHVINFIILIIVFVLSYITYNLIEVKARTHRRTPMFVLFGVISIVIVSSIYLSGLYNVHYNSSYSKMTYFLKYYDISPTQVKPKDNSALTYGIRMPERLNRFKKAYKEEGIITRVNGADPRIVLFGDSHGVAWARLVDEIAGELRVSRSMYTSNASKPFFNLDDINDQKANKYYTKQERVEYAQSVMRNIQSWNPKLVVIACRWSTIGNLDKIYLEQLINALKKLNIEVLIFNQPPRLNFMDDYNASQFFTYLGVNPVVGFNFTKAIDLTETRSANDYICQLQSKFSNVYIYDVFGNMVFNNKVMISHGKECFYFDDDHLSFQGTRYHKNNIKIIIEKLIHSSHSE